MYQTTQKFRLDAKTVFIAGGAGLLGRAFCHALGQSGASLAIADRDQAAGQKLCEELASEYGIRTEFYLCDISLEADVDRVVGQIDRDFGRIDVLCANAAKKPRDLAAYFKAPEDFSLETWRDVQQVNSDGTFLVVRAVGRSMIEKKVRGSIILTSSIYAISGPDDRIYEGSEYLGGPINAPVVYSATKAALLGLTKHLSTSWGKHGIRVNALLPGGVLDNQNETFVHKYATRVPLQRMANADEIATALVFLASDASSYITGQSLIVDGGLTSW